MNPASSVQPVPSTVQPPGAVERFALRLGGFLAGGRFAIAALWILFFYEVFVLAMTFAPAGSGLLGGFVEDFRIRCYQYEPRTGFMQWSAVAVMLAEPLPLAAIVLFVWWRPVRDVVGRGMRHWLWPGVGAALLVSVLGAGLVVAGRGAPTVLRPFPAEALRSTLPMPAFRLVDQDDRVVTPEGLRGRVVLVTAVYSTCTTACPMMLKRIREVLDGLSPEDRRGLEVVAFSLNPEVDTRELRTMIAKAYGLDGSRFHFLNGDADEVNGVLDRLGISRVRDAATGQISHSNLFLLLDWQGRIAYRLTLGDGEQAWVPEALRRLLGEAREGAGRTP